MPDNNGFAQWAILELMGHCRIAGLVTEATIAGAGFLRIDIFRGKEENPLATQFYNPSSVYGVSPVEECVARGLMERQFEAPVQRYELPAESSEHYNPRTPDGDLAF